MNEHDIEYWSKVATVMGVPIRVYYQRIGWKWEPRKAALTRYINAATDTSIIAEQIKNLVNAGISRADILDALRIPDRSFTAALEREGMIYDKKSGRVIDMNRGGARGWGIDPLAQKKIARISADCPVTRIEGV